MLTPFDGWTVAHALAGFFSGRFNFGRRLFYPIPIVWEIYQLYFHYQPQGHYMGVVWLNSLSDILVCVICYELAVTRSFGYQRCPQWLRINIKIKAAAAYVLIALAGTWVFWDDVFRLGLSAGMPSARVPLVLGAFSPAIASFAVWMWIRRGASHISGLPRLTTKPLPYFLLTCLLPSVVILVIIILIRGF